jgi:hypothetical protein
MADLIFDPEGFPRPSGTAPPMPSPEAQSWAWDAGYAAGAAGSPPMPPREFAGLAKLWGDGWRTAAEKRKPSGWTATDIDFDWKEGR